MSIKVMTDVWAHSQASGTDLLVLLALADNANDAGECWPSIRYIARKCRIDDRTTQRRIRSLEDLGEVVVIRGGGRASAAGGTRSNKYQIVIHLPVENEGGDLPGSGTDAGEGVAPVPGRGVAPVPGEPSLGTVNESNPPTPHGVGGQISTSRAEGTNPRATGTNPRAQAELEATVRHARRLFDDGFRTEAHVRERFDGIGGVPDAYVDELVEELGRLVAEEAA